LSLCPMLASRMLKGRADGHGGEAMGGTLAAIYRRTLRACLSAPAVVVTAASVFGALGLALHGSIKQELVPPEDRASAILSISAPQGAGLDYLSARMREIENLIAPLAESGEIENTFAIAGMGGRTNAGFMVLSLAPWEERARSQQEIVGEIQALVSSVPGV